MLSRRLTTAIFSVVAAFGIGEVGCDGAVVELVPRFKQSYALVESSKLPDKQYPAFPVLLDLGEKDILIGYKLGDSHASGDEASFELIHFDPATSAIGKMASLRRSGVLLQNGELVKFANGDVACYLDVQSARTQGKSTSTTRQGLIEFRSRDSGVTFQDKGKLGTIDGVEYGYAFEAITEANTTWMLVMTFANLPGGKSIGAARGVAGSVDVVRTEDSGKSWRRVQNLTHELGDLPINESSFLRYRNGFLVSTRGYDNHQWMHVTDGEFKLRRQVDLNKENAFIRSYVGRPRLFTRDGGYYLMGRNFTGTSEPMKLSLFRFDPETFAIGKHVILDNAEKVNVTDGYYAVPYWREREGKPYFNAITYKRVANRSPDILRLEYDWEEVR
jgi:hypothetical protein